MKNEYRKYIKLPESNNRRPDIFCLKINLQKENLVGIQNHKCRSSLFINAKLLPKPTSDSLEMNQKEKKKKTHTQTEAVGIWREREIDIFTDWYQWITRFKWRKRKNYSKFCVCSFYFWFVYFHLSFEAESRSWQLA